MRTADGRERPVCVACGFVVYLDPKLAVAVVVVRNGSVLLGLRAGHTRNPGSWSFPAGFVERGEVVEVAAAREVFEETGLRIELGPLLGLWSSGGDSTVLAAYAGFPRDDATPIAGDDLTEVGWFRLNDLPPLSFAHDTEILAAWSAAEDRNA